MSEDEISKQMSSMSVKTSAVSTPSTNSTEHSPKVLTPAQSNSQSNTTTSPMITPSHTQLNSDIQARIMAFQQQRSKKTSNIDEEFIKSDLNILNKDKSLPPIPPHPAQRFRSKSSNDAKTGEDGSVELSKKSSLSERRKGMKLNINDITPSKSTTPLSPPATLTDSNTNSQGAELQRRLSERKKKPNLKLNFNNDSSNNSPINDPQDLHDSPPAPPQLHGLFANYSKYIDIKSGSLNFTGKASLNSSGIDFSSGTSFRISLDQLQLIEELGRGNYGTVSKVLHKPTGVLMAMKEVRLELDESKFTQILMELEVLHKCHSPYIVDFYGAFFVEGAVYMCIEYMDGESLDKIYEKEVGIKNEAHLAYITESVIRGLKELKDNHNIIHRDVKPTNILVNSSGKVKLCDFGVSGNLVASLAKTNIGCQSYMAPERIKTLNPDDNTYSVQSDIWSLGLTILEIAKGGYPYPADTYNNIFSQLSAMVDGEPPKLDAKLYSKEAQAFVKSCLNKNPELRPSYQALLNHPWLVKYRDASMDTFEEYVKQRINMGHEKSKSGKPKENVSSILKGKVRAPALHRGGLYNNNLSFVNR